MDLNLYAEEKFRSITKTRGATELDNVPIYFIGCLHPESIIRFFNRHQQKNDGLLERYKIIYRRFLIEFRSMSEMRRDFFKINIFRGILFYCYSRSISFIFSKAQIKDRIYSGRRGSINVWSNLWWLQIRKSQSEYSTYLG